MTSKLRKAIVAFVTAATALVVYYVPDFPADQVVLTVDLALGAFLVWLVPNEA